MTRGKAIPRLQFLQDEEYRKSDSNIQNETVIALGMAIEALRQPEIIRCKDCKWAGKRERGTIIHWCDKHMEYHKMDYFCADGKRKEQQNDNDQQHSQGQV